MKDFLKKHSIDFVIIFVSILIYVLVIYPTININLLTYDSSYQYALNQKDFSEMMRLIPYDYSPALYSIFLKTYSVIFGYSLSTLRFSSFIVYMGIIILCLFPCKRAFDKKVSYVSAVCFSLSSYCYFLFFDIRPQVLGLLFISIACVYTYLVYRDGKKKDLIILTVFSVLAMYTHNVAMFAMFCNYGILLLFTLFKKEYKKSVNILISGLTCAITYIPNLIMLIHQYSNIQKNYWSDINEQFCSVITSTLLDNFYLFRNTLVSLIILLFLLSLCIFLILRYATKKNEKKNSEQVIDNIFLLLIYWLPISLYWLLTRFVIHIFAERYLYMFAFIALLEAIIFISKIDRKHIISCLLMLTVVFNFIMATKDYRHLYDGPDLYDTVSLIKKENPDETQLSFVHTHEWTLGLMMYYFPNANHYVTDDFFTVLNTYDVFPSSVININNPDNIENFCDEFYTFYGVFDYAKWDAGEYYSNNDNMTETVYEFCNGVNGQYVYTNVVKISIEK